MRALRLAVSLLAAAALPLAFAASPALADHEDGRSGDAVYASTNAAAGNAVLAFDRAPGGGLTPAGSFATGGAGTGAGLGNQGAIALDGDRLYVVNAGSGDISVFAVRRHGLVLLDRVASAGTTPISLTISRDVLYALNGGSGTIAGFRIGGRGLLRPIPGSVQPLAGAGPAEIAFAPDGRTLVVTNKGTNTIDTFAVGFFGRAGAAVSHPSNGATPFGFAFDHAGLHRVQPAVIPRNIRSIRVVEKAGFRREGRALRYLNIAGQWEDHDIFAMTLEDWVQRDGRGRRR